MASGSRQKGEHRPRVTLALPDNPLRKRILEVLDGSNVDVEVLGEQADLMAEIRDTESDVILVHTDQVSAGDLDALVDSSEGSSDAGVAVIGEDDPTGRARLFAAGASQVLSDKERSPRLGDTLEALAGAEASGGAGGPEVRGSEARPRLADFLTRSPRMREFVKLVQRVVPVDTSLLISGPTGVGKERLARSIHAEGPRAGGPFVAVNCAALPEPLLESELFGHEKGAFTGADQQRKGHFELASGGTIFLDEIGEMPTHLQVKLLTVLQRHEVVRVGGQRTIPVDVRVIAATNRDLSSEVHRGRFREDLYYRLNVVPLEIPALADRPDDIPDLAGRFISHFREIMPCAQIETISVAAVEALMAYHWPGNVRELINVIERAMVLGDGREITPAELPESIAQRDTATRRAQWEEPLATASPSEWRELPLKVIRDLAVRKAEAAYLKALLKETQGHIAETAKRAGLSTRALYDQMKRYDLRKEDFKTR